MFQENKQKYALHTWALSHNSVPGVPAESGAAAEDPVLVG